MPCVAPNRRAASTFDESGSIATITSAPAMRAPCTTLSPTPPHPITTTRSSALTVADRSTAPVPVTTPQASKLAGSASRSTGTIWE